jgi:hypothetical protein
VLVSVPRSRIGAAIRVAFGALAVAAVHAACAPAVLPRDGAPRAASSSSASSSVPSTGASAIASTPPTPLDRAVEAAVASARAEGLALGSRDDFARLEVSALELRRAGEPVRVALVGVAQPIALAIDGTPARFVAPILGERFPALRGDDVRFAVVEAQRCGPFCEWPRARVFEARAGAFVEGVGPSHPASGADVDGDRVPDFAVELVQVPLCEGCDAARVPDGEDGEALVVVGLETWDGTGWARDLASFERWYRDGLAEARADAKALAATPAKERKKRCPREAMQDAALVAVFARVLGVDAAKALAEADAIVAGWDTQACPAMRTKRRPWSELRKALADAPLPRLGRKRASP